jgi:HTH-type transcriptional regulator/antitoxin HigA
VVIPELSGVELLRELIVERELTQRDLVRAGVFATDSVASEVLAGKRSLNVDQVRALAQYFRLPADVFLGQPQAAV